MSDPRAVLKRAGLAPKRSFGQNFLLSPQVTESIARAAVPDDMIGKPVVLELGAGTGALTRALAARAREVIAVERDRDLVPLLTEELAGLSPGVRILEGDAQAVSYEELLGETPPRVLCGNLPYQLTGRLLEAAVVNAEYMDRVVFMVQREVAERLAAEPSTKAYGALTVFVRAAFQVKKLFDVSPGSFHPPPDVTSAVVLLVPIRPRRALETEVFRALVKGAFAMRRKTLRNAWRQIASLDTVAACAEASGISLDARGETLDVDAYARMASALETRLGRGASEA